MKTENKRKLGIWQGVINLGTGVAWLLVCGSILFRVGIPITYIDLGILIVVTIIFLGIVLSVGYRRKDYQKVRCHSCGDVKYIVHGEEMPEGYVPCGRFE